MIAVWIRKLYDEITSMQESIDIFVGETVPSFRNDTTSKQVPQIKKTQFDNKSAIDIVNNYQVSNLMTRQENKQFKAVWTSSI